LGMIAAMTGTNPACAVAGAVLGALYPHPKDSIASKNTDAVFIPSSVREFPYGVTLAKDKPASVRPVSFFCKENV
jgi:hypothetical protein